MDKFTGTLRAQTNDVIEIQKADYDLLTKINAVNSSLTDYVDTFQGNTIDLRIKKLTGITAAAMGGAAQIPHGLDSLKIIGITALVWYATGSAITPEYISSAGYQFDLEFDGTMVYIINIAGNSANILSKSLTILIQYEGS